MGKWKMNGPRAPFERRAVPKYSWGVWKVPRLRLTIRAEGFESPTLHRVRAWRKWQTQLLWKHPAYLTLWGFESPRPHPFHSIATQPNTASANTQRAVGNRSKV